MKNKAQAALEFMVTFVVMSVLLYSLIILWKQWSDRIIIRQQAYSRSRMEAVNSNGLDQYVNKNVYIGPGPSIDPWLLDPKYKTGTPITN